MRNIVTLGMLAGSLVIAGCSTGTTYGTGTSHEEATMKSVMNIFSMKAADKADIDYTPRPELVMPANKNVLPEPGTGIEQSDGADWPVSPERRIAGVRAAADAAEAVVPGDRGGGLAAEATTSTTEGIRNSAGLFAASRASSRSGGEDNFIKEIENDAKTSEEVQKRREQLAYSTGVKRKFLTEPPTEYRTPAATSEAGDLGVTDEEIEALRKQEREDRVNAERGVFTAETN